MANPIPVDRPYKVSSVIGPDGQPLNTFDKVKTHMDAHPEYHALQEPDREQKLNRELLQIISKGINDIVDALKMKLGNNFSDSNQNAFIINQRLENLMETINIDKRNIDLNTNVIQVQGRNINVNDVDIANANNFGTLDSPHINVIQNQDPYYGPESDFNRIAIEKRLKNCQNLEFLYLKKHDEIIKIFEFTINLFDKYKYAIKVILFLLKHLVYKDPSTPGDTEKINIPIPIIPDIKKLLIDQKKIQEVINKMKTVISPDVGSAPDPDAATADANIKVQSLNDRRTVSPNLLNNKIAPQRPPRPVRLPP